jgi:hypothetical protein
MKRFLMIGLMLLSLSACANQPETPPTGGNSAKPAAAETAKPENKTEVVQHPWAKFKVGSFVKTKSTSVTETAGKKFDSTSEIKQTLVDLTSDKAVVEIETTVMGNTTKSKIDIPINAAGGAQKSDTAPATAAAANPKQGAEDLTVAGKTLHCKWVETETEQGGNKVTAKAWTSEDVPGFMVKSVSKTTGSVNTEVTSELVDFSVK